jgi:flagellar biogenesis protein FliO
MPRRGLLGTLFFWLRGGVPARKQLRLVETVPLGEKRFVAIIHAQGRKYLVGGGTSGVALLTSLDEPASQSNSIAAQARPVEVAG